MKHLATLGFLIMCFAFLPNEKIYSQDASLHKLFDNYYEDRLKLFPLEATSSGDNRYNDILPNNGSTPYISQLNNFYDTYLNGLKNYNRQSLSSADRTSYDLLVFILSSGKEALSYHPEYIPANQFNSLALTMGILGTGNGQQPFKTAKDYENWLKRIDAFTIGWIRLLQILIRALPPALFYRGHWCLK